jgi:hypothetical protein
MTAYEKQSLKILFQESRRGLTTAEAHRLAYLLDTTSAEIWAVYCDWLGS